MRQTRMITGFGAFLIFFAWSFLPPKMKRFPTAHSKNGCTMVVRFRAIEIGGSQAVRVYNTVIRKKFF